MFRGIDEAIQVLVLARFRTENRFLPFLELLRERGGLPRTDTSMVLRSGKDTPE